MRPLLMMASGLWWLASSQAGTIQPRFSYTPAVAQPGQSITLQGTRFPPTSISVIVALTNDLAEARIVATLPVQNGSVNAQVPIPADLPPGRYLVGVADQNLKGAVNMTGPISIAPLAGPWFAVSPLRVAPGGIVGVGAKGFPAAATIAGVGIVDNADQVTVLGFAALTNGAMARTFAVPATQPHATTYRAFVIGSNGQYAVPTMGPFSVAISQSVATVPIGDYPVGIEANPLTNRIYAGNGGDSTVSVIDGVTNQVTATIPTGDLPCAMAMNLANNRLYVANLNSDNVTVIDGATNQVVATVPVGGAPCAVRVLPALNRVYVGNYRSNSISVISTASNTVVSTISLPGPPYGLGVNTQTNRVYSATGAVNQLLTIDGATNAILAAENVGKGPDAVAVNQFNNRIYVGNYFSDTLSVLDGNTNKVIATVRVGREPSGVAVNPVTGRVFVGNYGSDTVTVIEGLTNAISATIAVGEIPDGITVNPSTGRVYSVNSLTRDVTVIADPPVAAK